MPVATRLALLLFAASVAGNIGWAFARPEWAMLPAAIAGWYLADLASGIVHMLMDYRPCTPGIGLRDLYFYTGSRESAEYQTMLRTTMAKVGPIERLTYDFKNHHPRPLALGRRTIMRQIGSTIFLGSLPFSLVLNLACFLLPIPGWAVAVATAFLIGGTFSQYFHGTLHREDNPRIVRAMRATRLLMTPAMHEKHHETLQRDFATISGWSNPPLNIVFRALRRRGMLRDEGLEPA